VSGWFSLCTDNPGRPNKLLLKVCVYFQYNLLRPGALYARGAVYHFLLNKLAELKVRCAALCHAALCSAVLCLPCAWDVLCVPCRAALAFPRRGRSCH